MKKKEQIRNQLAALLGKWPKTVLQARNWLDRRGLEEGDADAILDDLQQAGLLDDALYARFFVEGHREWGDFRLRHELKRRGISGLAVREAIDEAHDPLAAEKLVRDWRKSGLDDRRIAGRLARRGFSAGEAMVALRSPCPGNE